MGTKPTKVNRRTTVQKKHQFAKSRYRPESNHNLLPSQAEVPFPSEHKHELNFSRSLNDAKRRYFLRTKLFSLIPVFLSFKSNLTKNLKINKINFKDYPITYRYFEKANDFKVNRKPPNTTLNLLRFEQIFIDSFLALLKT